MLLITGSAVPVGAQGVGAPPTSGRATIRVELAAAFSTPLVEDGNGVTVRSGIGPVVAADIVWRLRERTAAVATLRAAGSPLSIASSGRRWSAGSVRQLDVAVRLERAVADETTVAAGLTGSLLSGPRDVIPFRAGRFLVLWGGEVAIARRLVASGAMDAVLAGDVLRVGRQRDERLASGWVGRLRLGARHAF